MDDITSAIEGLTYRVFAYRIARIILRGTAMPLEIKGLRGKALKAAANLDRLNQAYDAFNEAALSGESAEKPPATPPQPEPNLVMPDTRTFDRMG